MKAHEKEAYIREQMTLLEQKKLRRFDFVKSLSLSFCQANSLKKSRKTHSSAKKRKKKHNTIN